MQGTVILGTKPLATNLSFIVSQALRFLPRDSSILLMQQLQACGCPQIISTLAEYLLVTANLQKDRKRRQEFVLRPRSTHTDLSAWEMLGCKKGCGLNLNFELI